MKDADAIEIQVLNLGWFSNSKPKSDKNRKSILHEVLSDCSGIDWYLGHHPPDEICRMILITSRRRSCPDLQEHLKFWNSLFRCSPRLLLFGMKILNHIQFRNIWASNLFLNLKHWRGNSLWNQTITETKFKSGNTCNRNEGHQRSLPNK